MRWRLYFRIKHQHCCARLTVIWAELLGPLHSLDYLVEIRKGRYMYIDRYGAMDWGDDVDINHELSTTYRVNS